MEGLSLLQSIDKLKLSSTKEIQNENLKAFIVTFVDPHEHESLLEIDKSLLRIESSLSIIFQFWIETSQLCSSLIEELASNESTKTSVNFNILVSNWMVYQKAIGKAAKSIAPTSQPSITEIDILAIIKDMVSDENAIN